MTWTKSKERKEEKKVEIMEIKALIDEL